MYKYISLLLTSFVFIQNVCSQTLEEKISENLLKAIKEQNDDKYVESIGYLDKCQEQLGDKIVPRIEELYIKSLIPLENPILLEKHINRYLSASNNQRKGYDDIKKISLKNKKDLKLINYEFKIAADSFFVKKKTEGGISLVCLSRYHNNYYINYLGECSFSVIAKNAKDFNNGYACIDEKIYNKKGDIVFEDKYDEFDNKLDSPGFFGGALSVKKNGKYGLLDSIGDYIITPKYEEYLSFNEFNITAKKGGKYGLLSWDGEVKIPFIYDEIYGYYGNEQFIVRLNDAVGLIDENNNVLVPIEYDAISFLDENNIACVKKDGVYGYVNNAGEVIVPIIYDKGLNFDLGIRLGNYFYENRSVVKLNNKYGVIDSNNREVVEFVYDSIRSHTFCSNNKVYAVEKKLKWGVLDSLGKVIIPFQYDEVSFTVHDEMILSKNNKSGVYDTKGKKIIPMVYDKIIRSFVNRGDNLYRAINGDDVHFYFEGKIVFKGKEELDFDISLPSLEEGILKDEGICKSNYSRKGIFIQSSSEKLLTHEGKSIFSRKYSVENLNFFKKRHSFKFFNSVRHIDPKMNLITLKNKDGKLAFADILTGEIITNFEYQKPMQFSRVRSIYNIYIKNNKYGLLDYNLEEVIPFEYDVLNIVTDNFEFIEAKKGGKYGILNVYGDKITPLMYDNLQIFKDGLVMVRIGKKMGLIDVQNKIIEPLIYSDINFGENNLVKLKLNGEWIEKQINIIEE